MKRLWRLARTFPGVVASTLLAVSAAATPTTLTVVVPQPQKQADIVVVSTYTGSSSFDVTGTLDVEIAVSPGGVATGLDLEGADLFLSDVTIILNTPPTLPFPGVFNLFDVTATLLGPPALFLGSNAGTSSFDLAGSQLVFDSGSARLFDPFTFNESIVLFAQNPVAFSYGAGSIAELTLTALGNGELAVSLSLPLDLTVVNPTGAPVVFSMSGDLASSGTAVPEPSAILLLGGGLLAVAFVRRLIPGITA
jgi:hypothetical protein